MFDENLILKHSRKFFENEFYLSIHSIKNKRPKGDVRKKSLCYYNFKFNLNANVL